jgi:hypothetical protein
VGAADWAAAGNGTMANATATAPTMMPVTVLCDLISGKY